MNNYFLCNNLNVLFRIPVVFLNSKSTREVDLNNPLNSGTKEYSNNSNRNKKSNHVLERDLKFHSLDSNTFGTLDNKYINKFHDETEMENIEQDRESFRPIRRKLSTKQYADIIKEFIKQRKIKEAIDVIEVRMLQEDRVKPENYLYNLLIGACGRVGYTKKAFMLFNDMKKRGLAVHPGCYTALFNACANSPWTKDGLIRAQKLRELMIEKRYLPNDSNYHAMIKAFGRLGDLETAFSLVDEMVTNRISITVDTFNFMLQSCITDKKKGFRHALLVWRKMIEKRIKPNLYSYNSILRVVRDCGFGDLCTQNVFEEICKNNLILSGSKNMSQDDTSLIFNKFDNDVPLLENNSLKDITNSENLNKFKNITAEKNIETVDNNYIESIPNLLAKVPQFGNIVEIKELNEPKDRLLLLGGCSGFLKEMELNEVSPNIKTFTQLLDNLPSTLAAENLLLSKMKTKRVKPDVDFFNMLIKRRSLRYDYNNAKEVLNLIEKEKLQPNVMTYGVLALCCSKKDEGLALLHMLSENGHRVNTEILGALLHKACVRYNFGYVLEIMNATIKENVNPNLKFMEHLKTFQEKCTQLTLNKNKTDLSESDYFKKWFGIFNKRYKIWLTEVKPDESETSHPWTQFREYSETVSKKVVDKVTHFKPRHLSHFRVKTSTKVRY